MKLILVPVEHLVLDSVMKLGKVLLIPLKDVLMNDYSIDEKLKDSDIWIIDYLLNNHTEVLEKFNELDWCSLAVTKGHFDAEKMDQIILDITRSLEFFIITQYRFDRREWTFGRPGAIGNTHLMGLINLEDNKIEFILDGIHNFCEIPGIGLEVSFSSPYEVDPYLYNTLFLERKDEIYLQCRNFISRACDAFYIMNFNGCFSHLFSVLEGIGMLGSNDFLKFTIENERIMSVISNTQNEYESRLDEFCYYSETLRTLIVHQGYEMLELMDIKSAFKVLTSIFNIIIEYASCLINWNIVHSNQLNDKIIESVIKFEKHSCSSPKLMDTVPLVGCEGDRDIFIVPIENLKIDKIFGFSNMLLIPMNHDLDEDQEGLNAYSINKIEVRSILLNKDIKKINKKQSLVLYRGNYKLDNINTSEAAFQYLDDICKSIQNELVFIILNEYRLQKRDKYFSALGIYDGYRTGFLYDTAFGEFYTILGRVYSLYNKTESAYTLSSTELGWLYYATLGNSRTDEIALDCNYALEKIGNAMYADSLNESFMYVFDAIEALYPKNFNTRKTLKWIIPFIMEERSKYDKVLERMNKISQDYRTPIYHYGKSIYDVISDENDRYKLFEEIKNIVLKYCKTVLETNKITYEELETERNKLMSAKK